MFDFFLYCFKSFSTKLKNYNGRSMLKQNQSNQPIQKINNVEMYLTYKSN